METRALSWRQHPARGSLANPIPIGFRHLLGAVLDLPILGHQSQDNRSVGFVAHGRQQFYQVFGKSLLCAFAVPSTGERHDTVGGDAVHRDQRGPRALHLDDGSITLPADAGIWG